MARGAVPAAPAVSLSARRIAAAAASVLRGGFGLSAGAGAWSGTGVSASVAPMLRLGWGGARGYLVRLCASGLGSVPECAPPRGSRACARA